MVGSETLKVDTGNSRHKPFNRFRRPFAAERRFGAVGEVCGPVIVGALADDVGHGAMWKLANKANRQVLFSVTPEPHDQSADNRTNKGGRRD